MEFTPILPAEALIVFLQDLINSPPVSLYVFQQSFVLISAIKHFLKLQNVSLSFGLDNDLIEKYFYADEVSKRLEYQRNMSENTVFPS